LSLVEAVDQRFKVLFGQILSIFTNGLVDVSVTQQFLHCDFAERSSDQLERLFKVGIGNRPDLLKAILDDDPRDQLAEFLVQLDFPLGANGRNGGNVRGTGHGREHPLRGHGPVGASGPHLHTLCQLGPLRFRSRCRRRGSRLDHYSCQKSHRQKGRFHFTLQNIRV